MNLAIKAVVLILSLVVPVPLQVTLVVAVTACSGMRCASNSGGRAVGRIRRVRIR